MARYDYTYVSTVSMLQQRELLNQALDIQEVEWNFMDFLELMNREQVTVQPTYTEFVNEDVYTLGTVAVGGGGTGTSVTVTLTDAEAATVTPGSLCFDHSNPAVIGYVKSVTGNDIEVHSYDGATSMTFTEGNLVSFYSTAAGEGSDTIVGKRYKLTPYTNQVQIFKWSVKITDIQKVSKVEVEFNGQPYYMIKAQHDALMKHRSDISFGLFFNKKAGSFNTPNSTLEDADGNPIQLTGGLDEYITSRGVDQTVSTSIDIDEFRTLTKTLDLRRAPNEYLVLTSSQKNIELDDLFNAMDTTPVLENARFSVDGRNIDLGVDSWRIYNRTYHKKWLPMLDAKNVTNFANAPTSIDAAYFLPMNKIKTDVSGNMIDRFRLRYMAGDGTDLKYRETLTGGLAPIPTNSSSYLEVAYQSTVGLEILGAEQFAKLS